jgi:hypothetical protein|tara:strand:- start:5753 stop:6013 length:261 start_codon:yes stop_codon:yes gene_type:complete
LKKKYVITLDEATYMTLTDGIKEQIYKMLPIGKKTTGALVAKSVGTSNRNALSVLTQLEKEGKVRSELGLIKFKKTTSRCRIFERL